MALVIPTTRSTFGDATFSSGDAMSKYILAQLPDDVSLDWLSDVRLLLGASELKSTLFLDRLEYIKSKTELWSRVETSMRSATVIVIDPENIENDLRQVWDSEGAEEGVDFDQRDLISDCAIQLIRGTPVAYLPNQLSEMLGLYPQDLYLSFDKFSPWQIKQRLGGKLRDAKIFAARAHAIFDVEALTSQRYSTGDVFKSPRTSVVFRELLSTQRGFDIEHLKSVSVLNDAAETIASALGDVLTLPEKLIDNPLVKEYDSRDFEYLQAADIAAGWARKLVALGDIRALGYRFGRVIINGRMMR
jgi:hypothetical protein